MLEVADKILASAIWLFTGIVLMIMAATMFSSLKYKFRTSYESWRNPKYSLIYQAAKGCLMPFTFALLFNAAGFKETFFAIVVCQVVCTVMLVTGSFIKKQ